MIKCNLPLKVYSFFCITLEANGTEEASGSEEAA